MNILEKAIQTEGSVNALAMSLGVKQNVISNWRARNSVPQGWQKLMEIKYSESLSDQATRVNPETNWCEPSQLTVQARAIAQARKA